MRWHMRRIACWLLLSISVHASASGSEPWQVGVLYWSDTIASQQVMRRGLEQEAERINQQARATGQRGVRLHTMVAGDGSEGVERQIWQMRMMVDNNPPDIIIVQPTDNAALIEPLQRANLAGIPVVAYDQYISGGVLASYVTSDNHQAGYLGGEYIASLFARQRPLRLVLVEYPLVSSTVERVNGFLDGLQAAGVDYHILQSYQAVQPQEGVQAARDLLRDFPDKGSVDAVFTVNNGAGLSLVETLVAAGRSEIIHATVDGDPGSVDNIRDGNLTRIDSAQFCALMGGTALQHAYRVLQGEAVPRQVIIPAFPVTMETLELYPGWQGSLPPSFTKPWPSTSRQWQNRLREGG